MTQDLKNKLQVIQNRLIRFVLDLDPRSHISRDHFVKLNWLPVSSRVDQITLSHVFRIRCDKAPCYMKENFIPASTVHNYATRFRVSSQSSSDFLTDTGRYSIPKVKGFGQKTFAYKGCTLWNDLPQSIRDSKNLTQFKSCVKSNLLASL